MLPSTKLSSRPVTVTVCAMFQLPSVKVSSVVDSVASELSLTVSAIVTLALGASVSTTLNCAVAPASLVTRPLVGVTTMPPSKTLVTVTAIACVSVPPLPSATCTDTS